MDSQVYGGGLSNKNDVSRCTGFLFFYFVFFIKVLKLEEVN